MATATAEGTQQAQGVRPGQQLAKMLNRDTVKTLGGTGPLNTILATVAGAAWQAGEVGLVARYIETAVALDLNPLLNEIWLVDMAGRNASNRKLAMVVGRDGYLKVARRQSDFRGVTGAAVYEADEFHVSFEDTPDGPSWKVEHTPSYSLDRGKAIGAWAKVYRDGFADHFFFAPASDYAKASDNSAWKFFDAMMVKCAISYVLRTTYGIAGPTPIDEMSGVLNLPPEGGADAVGDGVMDPIDARVRGLWERVRDIDALAFPEGIVRARTMGGSDEQVAALAAEMEAWLAEHEPPDATVVEPGEGDRAAAEEDERVEAERPEPEEPPEEEPPVDAEVVEVPPEFRQASERYVGDEQWAEQVDALFSQLASAEREILGAQTESKATAAQKRADEIARRLSALGVPDGWSPGCTPPGEPVDR